MLFEVLGPVAARDHDGTALELGARKPITVLATLLLHANSWVRVDELLDTTWHEQAMPASAEANLKTYVWHLRRALPSHADGNRIEHRPGAYRIRVSPGELDTHRVDELAAAVRGALAIGDGETAERLATRALSLWRGRPFEGLVGESLAVATAQLDETRWALRENLAAAQLMAGRSLEAVSTLRSLVAEDPLREGAWAVLIDALCRAGRRGEALAAYRGARNLLARELGIEPGTELTEAHRRALAGPCREVAGPPLPRRELPRDVHWFTGRNRELAVLKNLPAAGTPTAVIDGMPGVGKTALAVRAAHDLAAHFPDGQFFVDLRAHTGSRPPAAGEVLARLLRGIGVTADRVPEDPDERSALWRSELAGRRVLLVLDDAEDVRQIAPLLPGESASLTLITTRNGDWRVPGARQLGLAPLDPGTAADLFRRCVGDARPDAEPSALAELVRTCAGLPEALRGAADRFAARPSWGVADLVEWLGGEPGRLLEPDGSPSVLSARISMSYQRLSHADQAAFRAVGAVSGEVDARGVARRLRIGQSDARRLLERLVDRHLLTAPAAGRYRMHPVVREQAYRVARAEGAPAPGAHVA